MSNFTDMVPINNYFLYTTGWQKQTSWTLLNYSCVHTLSREKLVGELAHVLLSFKQLLRGIPNARSTAQQYIDYANYMVYE